MNTKTSLLSPVAAVLSAVLVAATLHATASVAAKLTVDVMAIPAGEFSYQAAGQFVANGMPVDAPQVNGKVDSGWLIMQRQVSQAEYAQCVKEKACKRLDKGFRHLEAPDLPAVGISWNDAKDYAAWLSAKTGQVWDLPDYEQWVRAASNKYRAEDALPSDPNDPSVRWLAEYDRETARRKDRIKPAQEFGFFGVNDLGLVDMAGNVWEWTNTCFASYTVGILPVEPRQNCGIRIIAGAHVAAMSDFIRDPRNGACSIGLPPANLGFRLVRKL